jgi:phosphoribosylformylglycinamidine (FGAM) synthase-like enzyme
MDYEKRVQSAAREIATLGLAESAHDVSDGGLAVALAEASFGPAGIGASLDLDSGLRPELLLFHEGPSRILYSAERPEELLAIALRLGVEALVVGKTVEGRLSIRNRGVSLIDCDVQQLRRSWEGALEAALEG